MILYSGQTFVYDNNFSLKICCLHGLKNLTVPVHPIIIDVMVNQSRFLCEWKLCLNKNMRIS